MRWISRPLLAGAVLLTGAGLAQADMMATTATDLTVYSGPGTEYPSVGVATRGSSAALDGCLDGQSWCRIDVNGMRGWVFAQELTVDYNGAPVVVQERRVDLGVPVVSYEQTGSVTGLADPAPGDELIGKVDGAAIVPPPEVLTYIERTPLDTVPYEGEVAVGATLPGDMVITEVPNYQYSYVRINDRPMLVDPQSRRIVYVYE
ncbi:DUF1236 domain-containing protein [Pararhizobium sp. BT-229]|uniref:DUF1236 domain-containing protein n=1 Tax=Pararhizobium sp. BT-229 TaxID=2986923 RepID=UPI0021F7685B|nr:DUF1236 domain-containing protein [Pararhizobium sp. BT-229]MCV9960901.1 DUF1236 domain-containing protein [Pararhizobium sp. BT-229]